MPSPRPVKPRPLAGRRLDAHLIHARAPGPRPAARSSPRGAARSWAARRRSPGRRSRSARRAAASSAAAWRRNMAGVGVPPGGIAGREVAADVAGGDRAEHRVGHGVEGDVGVGMAGEAELVRDAHPAQDQRPIGREGVDVEAQAGAPSGRAGRGTARRPPGPRAGSASCCAPRRPRPRPRARPRRRSRYRRCSRRRRAGGAPPGSPRSGSPAASAPAPGRRARPPRRPCPAATRFRLSTTGRTGSTAACDGRARPATRSITAAETSGRAASWISTRSGASSTRLSRPRRTVSCRAPPPITGGSRSSPAVAWRYSGLVAGADHDPDAVDPRMPDERFDCMSQDRLAVQVRILLGQAAAEALTTTGGDDEYDGVHPCHAPLRHQAARETLTCSTERDPASLVWSWSPTEPLLQT